jgi:low molecular weight phosphotyrosine protein phosphatase
MCPMQIRESDFHEFDYIFAMDQSNLMNLERWQNRPGAKNGKAEVKLFGYFSGTPKAEQVQDPYYSGGRAFEKAYEQCRRFSLNFLADTFPGVAQSSS